jgi:toxin ParE1/3/4
LKSFPRRGRATDRVDIRELVLTRYPYTIIYEIADAEVRILAVFHQAQNRP